MTKSYQYCVVLRKGENSGIRQYRWSSREKIVLAMYKIYYYPKKNREDLFSLVLKDFQNAKVKFKAGRIGSLEIEAEREDLANKVAEYLGLPPPFNYE